MQGQISAALGREDATYRVTALQAVNPVQHLRAGFSYHGVSVASGNARLGMALAAYGYASALKPARSVSLSTSANRVSYKRGALTEWYANGPFGIEQGFDVVARPSSGAGPLTLSLALSGNMTARLRRGSVLFTGRDAQLRYVGLLARDARGRVLRSWLQLDKGYVLIRVDDRGAIYPLRIDPLLEQLKIVSADEAAGSSEFGYSVALSADGSTALIGGPNDNSDMGAAWIFTRAGTTWTEQQKIVPSDEGGRLGELEELHTSRFGSSVALSSDGSIALIGGPADDTSRSGGSAWIYRRSGTTWTEQQKLIPNESVPPSSVYQFGASVALSADGTYALIGGPASGEREAGAVWVFVRSNATWTEQQKIVPTDESPSDVFGPEHFGASVALSREGNVALIGDPDDGNATGAAWVYSRSTTSWSEQQKIVPTDETQNYTGSDMSEFGSSVSLSGEGNIALIGGPSDGSGGAAWVYTSSGTTWSKQQKIIPSEAAIDRLGSRVALSSDGSTALVGGDEEYSAGAAWVYTVSGSTWSEQQKVASGEDGLALSEDGTTALIGGSGKGETGTAWVFARSGVTWTEQQKITPAGETDASRLGYSVALSSDGDTALIGGPFDGSGTGAAWIFIRTMSGVWEEQQKLTPVSGRAFGISVALSADGNTALIGGPGGFNDRGGDGAAWVFTRSGATWAEQQKIVPANEMGFPNKDSAFGFSVALSADGNTALIGGPNDGNTTSINPAGAAWVYARVGTAWTEQQKIVPTDESNRFGAFESRFGFSVALSADGDTALVSGPSDGCVGSAWVYARSGADWVEQQKIAPNDEDSRSPDCGEFGHSVALSAGGNTALIGDPQDGSTRRSGAAWVYARSAAVWTEQQKIAPSDETESEGEFGFSVALAASGDAALIGGPYHAGPVAGAAWLFSFTRATWTEREKIVPNDEAGNSEFGAGVALSRIGGTLLIGGPADNEGLGAAWVFGAPAISTPTNLSYGSQPIGQAGPVLWLQIASSGQQPLTFTSPAQISGTNPVDFAIPAGDDLCNDTTLDPGESCWIGVRFDPSTSGSRGAALELGTNNGVGAEPIELTGTGLEATSGPAGASGTNGAQGIAGTNGAPGPQGLPGATGPSGPAGKNGDVEVVVCKSSTIGTRKNRKAIQMCTTKRMSSRVTVTTAGRPITAMLSRDKVLYARGSAVFSGKRTELQLTLRRHVTKGKYTLTLMWGRMRRHETITIESV